MQPLLCSSLLPASSFVAYGFQLLPTSGLNVQPSLLYSTGRPANSVVAVRALFGVGSKPKAAGKGCAKCKNKGAVECEGCKFGLADVMIVKALDSWVAKIVEQED